MNKSTGVRLPARKTFRLVIAVILSVSVGRTLHADGQTVTILYSFGTSPNDGGFPYAGLVQASDGNFYGTTEYFGTNNNGTLFRISPGGAYTNLYSFGISPNDGVNPSDGLVQGSDGNLYGTTFQGGTTNQNTYFGTGYGTVFRIGLDGVYTNLYSFSGYPSDGELPFAGLVQGSDANFYGTTSAGGTGTNCSIGCGTVFRISPSGSEAVIYSFGNFAGDGADPGTGLVRGSDGNFYGTTSGGGTNGYGTVYRISPNGTHTNLYSFVGYPNDGLVPSGGLVQGSDGSFYGTANIGGTNDYGTVFRISPSGSYTNLYSFGSSQNDGHYPNGAGLVQGSDGNFYGTTSEGGTNPHCGEFSGCGTVFRISPRGSYTNLYSFGGFSGDSTVPLTGLVQGGDGNFYGTTERGGTNDIGTVFKLTVPLSPPPFPINQITGVQLSGTNIVFNIPSIAYETYQLQFSSSMTLTNWVNVYGVSVTNSIGALLTLTNFGGALGPQGLYRFDITP